VLRRQREENQKFEDSLGYIAIAEFEVNVGYKVRPCL
jgi:hypothetical protein